MAESAVTSEAASCAPPPQTIIGFFAAPRSFAALRIAASSGFGRRTGNGGCGATLPGLPQTSMAHCSEAGPGRPSAIARIASATRRGACSGLRISAE